MKKNFNFFCFLFVLALLQISCNNKEKDFSVWQEDLKYQPIESRPSLEVTYTDSSRTAFEIIAQKYQLTGQLRQPNQLVDKNEGNSWLWIEMESENGIKYSSKNYKGNTRINLYRRGPYYCEIHWLDFHVATEKGDTASLIGDLVLYCYPEKILGSVVWHGTGSFNPGKMDIKGIVQKEYTAFKPFEDKTIQEYSFPMYGETKPLSDDAFKLISGVDPVRYDEKRGCYILGTHTNGGFQEKFYEEPNKYEQATFSVTNDSVKRKIYICQESSDGGQITEGGIVLDSLGHPLPIVVQVSKNFGGEMEERFYNPTDIPFSETFFPLYLEPGESHTLTTMHLFQNWGRHMTKHWSSLGAWMDYFHSSTGVTETTCYVPFKFGGLGGVAIADFRAMSQDWFWSGQPQHNNLAGHSFLSYFDGKDWIHSVYTGTTYRSTGPNWYDIGLHYLSADGKIKETINIFESPQDDELRSYFKARYEVLKPMTIEDANVNFRFLNITSSIQSLRFNRFAATGVSEIKLDPEKKPFPVKGVSLPDENFFLAVYGDTIMNRGSDAIIVKKFSAPGFKPAATVQLGSYNKVFYGDHDADTRLILVPDADKISLKAGDVIEIEGYWLPYGATYDTKSPEMVTNNCAKLAPHVVSVSCGEKISDFPVIVKAKDNKASFSVAGGKNLIPVVVKGFTKWRNPQIFVKENKSWRPLLLSRNNKFDGYQVFCDEYGTIGSVFLVPASLKEQEFKVTIGKEYKISSKIDLNVNPSGEAVSVKKGEYSFFLNVPAVTPEEKISPDSTLVWHDSEGSSLWFTQTLKDWIRGGRFTPNEDDIDLEYWWQNLEKDTIHSTPKYIIDLKNITDSSVKQFYVMEKGKWDKILNTDNIKNRTIQAVAVKLKGDKIIALSFRNADGAFCSDTQVGLSLKQISVPLPKRYHVRGKLYIVDSGMEVLKERILRDFF